MDHVSGRISYSIAGSSHTFRRMEKLLTIIAERKEIELVEVEATDPGFHVFIDGFTIPYYIDALCAIDERHPQNPYFPATPIGRAVAKHITRQCIEGDFVVPAPSDSYFWTGTESPCYLDMLRASLNIVSHLFYADVVTS